MAMEDIVGIIFEDIEEVKPILSDSEGNDLEGNDLSEAILEYGISEGKFLCVDYGGEEGSEIINYIMDYEFSHGIELATQEELEELDEMEYDDLTDKIKEVNKILEKAGYGLFCFPTGSDFYALFIAKLEDKEKLLEDHWKRGIFSIMCKGIICSI